MRGKLGGRGPAAITALGLTGAVVAGLAVVAGVAVVAPIQSVGATPAPAAGNTYPAPANTYLAPANGVWTVVGHGNGHGHGLSQYGAYGRAVAGQNMPQIVSFYYPGAALQPPSAAIAATPIRVQLGRAGTYTTVAASPNVFVSGLPGPLTSTGVSQFRLVPAGAGLGLQALTTTWQPVLGAQNLPATATFSTNAGLLTLVRADGSRGFYRGTISAVRNGAADVTVNTLRLDDYVKGVAPNESPSSWPAAALQSQVVAARTYALFEVRTRANAGSFDVCDSSSCQVYGGASSEVASTSAAADVTAGSVLTYAGAPIFAQFSSSNGGWTAEGGKPYLQAQADPFDNASTDPWFNWTRAVPVSRVASYYGLSAVSGIRVLARDGHGDWGGNVTSVAIDGRSGGKLRTVTATGYSIRSAMNLPLQWFTITNGGHPLPLAPTGMSLRPADRSVTVAWAPPPANGAKPVRSYVITVAGFARKAVPASTGTVTFSGMVNGRSYRIYVQALNADGIGAASALVALASPAPAGAPPAPARVTQWSANTAAHVYWAKPSAAAVTGYSVTVLGRVRYQLPATATQVMVPSLPNAVSQTVYVRALNADGEGPAFVVGVRPMAVPAPPPAVALTTARGSVTVRWHSAAPANSAVVPKVAGYSVTVIGRARTVVGSNTHAAVLTGLVPGRLYRLYVRAMNALGEGPAYMTAFLAA